MRVIVGKAQITNPIGNFLIRRCGGHLEHIHNAHPRFMPSFRGATHRSPSPITPLGIGGRTLLPSGLSCSHPFARKAAMRATFSVPHASPNVGGLSYHSINSLMSWPRPSPGIRPLELGRPALNEQVHRGVYVPMNITRLFDRLLSLLARDMLSSLTFANVRRWQYA